MPKRPCLEPRCPNFAAPKGRGRCKDCSTERERTINRAGKKVYSTKRWRLTRRKQLAMEPLCQDSECEEIATDVDHIVPLARSGAPFSFGNLQSLCVKHHHEKSMAERLK